MLYQAHAGNNQFTQVAIAMHTHTCPFNGRLSGTTRVSRYLKGETNLDFTEARDSDWQWHQLGCMQVCISLQTDNYASTPPFSFFTARCPSCCPTVLKHWRPQSPQKPQRKTILYKAHNGNDQFTQVAIAMHRSETESMLCIKFKNTNQVRWEILPSFSSVLSA